MSFFTRASASCLLLAAAAAFIPAAGQNKPEVMNIGMAKGFFTDIPDGLVQLVRPSFAKLMKQCTGLNGQLVVGGDHKDLTDKLKTGDLSLAVYHGFEFAWAAQIDPELQPLMIAINWHREVHAYLMVKADSNVKGFVDLRDKEVAYPYRNKEHCRIFMAKHATQGGVTFKKLNRSFNTFVALDDVLSGQVDAAVVDRNSYETYADVNPGRAKKLRIAQKSETFPAAVIAYRKGKLDDATLKKFREGMICANKNEQAREIMTMYNVTAFEPVPENYEQMLADVLKAHPAPR